MAFRQEYRDVEKVEDFYVKLKECRIKIFDFFHSPILLFFNFSRVFTL